MGPFTDMPLTCRQCGASFVFTAGEQDFYRARGFDNAPTHCFDCRRARKGDRYGRPRAGNLTAVAPSGGLAMPATGVPAADQHRQARQLYLAVCDGCGRKTVLPVRPTGTHPTYCPACAAARDVPDAR